MLILVTFIEHSEEKGIAQSGVFENEIEPGALQSSVQKHVLQERLFILVTLIEHSEDKVIAQSGVFENEIEPGMLQSSFQKTCFARTPVEQSKGQ